MSRLDIAESALKAVGGLSIVAMLALLALPRRTPPREVELQPAIEANAPSARASGGEARSGCLRCDPGVDCPCAKSGRNITYACLSGAPGPGDGPCMSRNYVRTQGRTYACWSCSPPGEHAVESQD